MKVDTGVMAPSLSDIGPRARELEELGYDGLLTAETGHDPFLPIVLAAEHTERIELGTGIAVAFARTPMMLAYTANDLQQILAGPVRRSASARRSSRTSRSGSRCRGRTRRRACASSSWRCGRSGRRGTTGRRSTSDGDFYRTR